MSERINQSQLLAKDAILDKRPSATLTSLHFELLDVAYTLAVERQKEQIALTIEDNLALDSRMGATNYGRTVTKKRLHSFQSLEVKRRSR